MDPLDWLGVVTILYWTCALLLISLGAASKSIRAALSYGKHRLGWGASRHPPLVVHAVMIRGTVPNRLAWRTFYTIGLLINTVLLREYFTGPNAMTWGTLAPAIMFELHVSRRLLECLYVHNFFPRYMPLMHFAAAVSFYFFTPLTPFLDEILYPRTPSPSRILAAAILFSAASLLQCLVHIRLADTKSQGGSFKYGVPRGGLFELVAAPHYTAEVVIYTAFLICSNGTGFFAVLNWMFVLANLSQTALETSAWYQRTFPASLLPPKRKAIIPHML